MRFLTIDIETSPNLVEVWSLDPGYIDPSNIIRHKQVVSFAAKWLDETRVIYHDLRHGLQDESMVTEAWDLLNEADAVIHYNGRRFDIPHLNTEFKRRGLNPPASFWQVDLLKVVRQQFNFTSNRLAEVVQQLDLGEKMKHETRLQSRCMDGEASAWQELRAYNVRDVEITEKLYLDLRPWIRGHPNLSIGTEDMVCRVCASRSLRAEGSAYTQASEFGQVRCLDCGALSLDPKRVSAATARQAPQG